MKTIKKILKEMLKANPYPYSLFASRSMEEWQRIQKVLKANHKAIYLTKNRQKLSPDGIFGEVARNAWEACINDLQIRVEDEEANP